MSLMWDALKAGRFSERYQIRGREIAPGLTIDTTFDAINEVLERRVEVIVADNVAEYYFQRFNEGGKIGGHGDLMKDIWNYAPPYEQFWIEYRIPQNHEQLKESGFSTLVSGFGALFAARELQPSLRKPETIREFLLNAFNGVARRVSQVGEVATFEQWEEANLPYYDRVPRWIVRSYTFGRWSNDDPETIQGPLLETSVLVDGNGELCMLPVSYSANRTNFSDTDQNPDKRLASLAQTWAIFTRPCMMAVTFMHGSNAELETVDPEATLPAKVRAKRERTGKPKSTVYKTINIRPVKKAIQQAAKDMNVSEQEAMRRMCLRGHWKHYNVTKDGRQSTGLFGKHRGSYFWHGWDKQAEPRKGGDYKVKAS